MANKLNDITGKLNKINTRLRRTLAEIINIERIPSIPAVKKILGKYFEITIRSFQNKYQPRKDKLTHPIEIKTGAMLARLKSGESFSINRNTRSRFAIKFNNVIEASQHFGAKRGGVRVLPARPLIDFGNKNLRSELKKEITKNIQTQVKQVLRKKGN